VRVITTSLANKNTYSSLTKKQRKKERNKQANKQTNKQTNTWPAFSQFFDATQKKKLPFLAVVFATEHLLTGDCDFAP